MRVASSSIAGMALHMAAHNGDVNRLRHLLRNVFVPTAVNTEDQDDAKEMCNNTLDDGGVEENYEDVNLRDFDEHTPLHIACIFGHAEAAQFLIQKGADVHAEDENGQTPLHYAARYCREHCARVLLTEGKCDAGRCDRQYQVTPLHFAATHGNVQLMRMLLVLAGGPSAGEGPKQIPTAMTSLFPSLPTEEQEYLKAIRAANGSTVNINAKTKNGETALHDAAQHHQVQAIRLLLRFATKNAHEGSVSEESLDVNAKTLIHAHTPLAIVKRWPITAEKENLRPGEVVITAATKAEIESLLESCGGHV